MVKVFSNGWMAEGMKEITTMIKNKDMGFSYGLMEDNMKGIGLMENNMVKESFLKIKRTFTMASGDKDKSKECYQKKNTIKCKTLKNDLSSI